MAVLLQPASDPSAQLALSWRQHQGAVAAAGTALAVMQQVAAGAVPAAHVAAMVREPRLAGDARAGLGAEAPSSTAHDNGAAAVWGLLRTAATEQPNATFSLLGASPLAARRGHAASVQHASSGLLAAASEQAGALLVPRLQPSSMDGCPQWVSIQPEPRSSLANLVARPVALEALAPGPGEVLLNVKAIGINFRWGGRGWRGCMGGVGLRVEWGAWLRLLGTTCRSGHGPALVVMPASCLEQPARTCRV